MNKRTVSHIINIYNNEERIVKQKQGGRREKRIKYNDDIKEIIINYQLNDQKCTLKQIQSYIKNKTTLTIPTSSIHDILISADFTTKMLKKVVINRNTKELKLERAAYVIEAAEWDEKRIIFVDENPFP